MSKEIVTMGSDRRQSPRFPLPIGQVFGGDVAEVTLLNISRHGMAIEVPVAASLARGGSHRFTLQDLNHSVEVQGRVCWVRSDWREQGAPGTIQYFQVAGFGFERILTEDPTGIWSNLQPFSNENGGQDPNGSAGDSPGRGTEPSFPGTPSPPRERVFTNRTVTSSRSLPPTLIVPLDGSTLDLASLTVVCKVSNPEEVTSVNINGVRADLDGSQASADVALKPGFNRLRALICRVDGSYRTFSLGTVSRRDLT